MSKASDCSSCSPTSQMSEGIRVWDVSAGEKHTLLLADGDCIQPIIYYSGQQVKEEAQEEEEEKEEGRGHQSNQQEQGEEEEQEEEQTAGGGGGGGGGYTQQPVLLPFCMNVRTENGKLGLVDKPSVFTGPLPSSPAFTST